MKHYDKSKVPPIKKLEHWLKGLVICNRYQTKSDFQNLGNQRTMLMLKMVWGSKGVPTKK